MNTTLIDLIREYGQTQQLAGATAATGSAAAQNYRATGARLLNEIEQRLAVNVAATGTTTARRVDVDRIGHADLLDRARRHAQV